MRSIGPELKGKGFSCKKRKKKGNGKTDGGWTKKNQVTKTREKGGKDGSWKKSKKKHHQEKKDKGTQGGKAGRTGYLRKERAGPSHGRGHPCWDLRDQKNGEGKGNGEMKRNSPLVARRGAQPFVTKERKKDDDQSLGGGGLIIETPRGGKKKRREE